MLGSEPRVFRARALRGGSRSRSGVPAGFGVGSRSVLPPWRAPRASGAFARRFRAAAGVLCLSLLSACSFDYGESVAEDLADRTPDAVFTDFQHTVARDNEPALRLSADKAELFDRKNRVHLYGVRFEELRDGEVLAFGSAEEAVLNTDTEDAEFFGQVNLRSEKEGVTIRTGYLSWNADDRTLASRPDQITEMERDDGSRIRGLGFRADARRKAVYFSGDVEGVLVRSEPGEEE